jgi:hypothetical protein
MYLEHALIAWTAQTDNQVKRIVFLFNLRRKHRNVVFYV